MRLASPISGLIAVHTKKKYHLKLPLRLTAPTRLPLLNK
jgi:hypothetical protein